MNFVLEKLSASMKLQICELKELRNETYDNSKNAKSRMKIFHEKNIVPKAFGPSQKVLLYNSRLHLFPRKLRLRWIGPYIVKQLFRHGAVEIKNPSNSNVFKVNGQRLKPFYEGFVEHMESIDLMDPKYLE